MLLVGIDTDKYGAVRISGSAMVLAPSVEELLRDSVPRSAVTEGQEINYGRLPFGWPERPSSSSSIPRPGFR